jgi:hypothetical protein
MARAQARDLVRVARTGRQFFQQMAAGTGCSCINGFAISVKQEGGKRDPSRPCIVFYVSQKLSLRSLPVHNRIPRQINLPWEHSDDGVLEILTDVVAATFQAVAFTGRERPCPAGISIGHVDITAGTLGCWVRDRSSGTPVILSNNHVMANSNQASIGDPILQPGPADGGTPSQDTIARLTRFRTIDFSSGANNTVDGAIATPTDPGVVDHAIKAIGGGIPTETRDIGVDDLGDPVQKSGRTTEHTQGTVQAVNGTVNVKYGIFEKATFVDQIIVEAPTGDFSAGGDSGSAVLDSDNKLIGLLFAGSEGQGGQPGSTIINPIRYVFSQLDLETLS